MHHLRHPTEVVQQRSPFRHNKGDRMKGVQQGHCTGAVALGQVPTLLVIAGVTHEPDPRLCGFTGLPGHVKHT